MNQTRALNRNIQPPRRPKHMIEEVHRYLPGINTHEILHRIFNCDLSTYHVCVCIYIYTLQPKPHLSHNRKEANMGFDLMKTRRNGTPLFVFLVSLILSNLYGQGILIAPVEADGKVSPCMFDELNSPL